MTTINQPRTTVNIVNASQAVGNTGQRVLLIGQMLSGSATPGALVQQIGNDNSEDALFGARSQLAGAVRAYKRINKATRVDAIGLADAGGASKKTSIFTITGPATEIGELEFVLGSDRDHSYTIAVASADTATIIGDALAAAITADPNVPYTAVNVAGVVTCTAANGGTVANDEAIAVRGEVAGVAVALSGAAGGTDPTLTTVFDVIADERYQGFGWPYSDTSVIDSFLEGRLNVTGKVLDGVGFIPFVGTSLEVQAQTVENNPSLVYLADYDQDDADVKGASQLEIGYKVCAYFTAIRALRLDVSGQSVANVVISTYGPLDSFGGPALASKPYFNTPLSFVNTNAIGLGFDDSEIEANLEGGASSYGNNIANSAVIVGEVVTTYLTDVAGNPDDSFKYLNYMDTASQCREYFHNNLRARFAQSRLTTGDTIPGRDMANAATIQGYLKQLYQALSGADFVLLEAGEAALKQFLADLVITLDTQTGTATIQMEVPIVTQLRTINATMKIAFSTNS